MVSEQPVNGDGPAPAPRPAGSVVTLALLAAVVVATAAWYVSSASSLRHGAAETAQGAVAMSSNVLQDRLQQTRRRLKGEAQLLAEDPRLKSTLATHGIDEATIADILQDLHRLLELDMVATLTPEGRVAVVIGHREIHGLDLSGAQVVRSAGGSEGATTDLWGVGDRLMTVGVAEIRSAGRPLGFIVVGAGLDVEALAGMGKPVGTAAGLLIGDRVLVAEGEAATTKDALRALGPAATAEPVVAQDAAKTTWVVRQELVTEKALPARVVWLQPLESGREAYRQLGVLNWVPMILVILLGTIFAWWVGMSKRSAPALR